MKGFFKWFRSSSKIKRWILLVLVGIVGVCYAIDKILVTQEMGFKDLVLIVGLFVIGFTFVIIGIIHIQKRTLEMYVQESDTRNLSNNAKVSSLIFNKKVYDQGPKVVVIGGGKGLNSVLKGLKTYTDNITAIVTVSDYGKKQGEEKKKNELQALDDIKQSMIALAINEEEMNNLLNFNMKDPKLSGLNFGDIYLSTMKEAMGDLSSSVGKSKNVLNMIGKILPATEDPVTICAELNDGTIVESKEKIPEIVNEKVSKINRIYITPTNNKVGKGVIDAIKDADAIVIGPGSLYTNVIPNLLVPGITKAIKESNAFKIYVCNIMTEMGQTDNYSLSDHIKALIDHAGKGIVDYCIYDTGEIVPEFIKKYNMQGSEIVEQDKQKAKEYGIRLIQRNLSMIDNERIVHNPDILATTIIELICEDLKYRDMENDSQFIMLDSKVKNTKKRLKEQDKIDKKQNRENNNQMNKSNKKRSKSKFLEKYNDRVEAIRESEVLTKGKTKKDKIKENIKIEEKLANKEKMEDNTENKIENKTENKQSKIKEENNKKQKNKEEVNTRITDSRNKIKKILEEEKEENQELNQKREKDERKEKVQIEKEDKIKRVGKHSGGKRFKE